MANSSRAPTDNQRTIAAYESYAQEYDKIVEAAPSEHVRKGLRELAAATGEGARILEIGSGCGRDADFIETLGVQVHRTEPAEAFLELQRARGKTAHMLDVVEDELGGPYDGVMVMCVLFHIERAAIDAVLRKLADALRPGGGFLVSMREGEGETRGEYLMTYWSRDDFAARLEQAGLVVEWDYRHLGRKDERWFTLLARRT